jgi:carbon monoxide dehydrogenase subunit G
MELTNEFRVGVPVQQAWSVLTDVERIAPCLPGAQLQEVEGDEYRGVVKVKVGPITAQYKGVARFVEQDPSSGRVVLRAEGRDTRGQGNAMATITATMTPDGDGTAVSVVTDLTITGKVAQFGRGVLAEVSAKLLDQFVASLEADVLSPSSEEAGPENPDGKGAATLEERAGSPADGAEPAAGSRLRRIESAPAQPVDLIDVAGGSVARRAAPGLVALAVLFGALLLARRRRRRSGR